VEKRDPRILAVENDTADRQQLSAGAVYPQLQRALIAAELGIFFFAQTNAEFFEMAFGVDVGNKAVDDLTGVAFHQAKAHDGVLKAREIAAVADFHARRVEGEKLTDHGAEFFRENSVSLAQRTIDDAKLREVDGMVHHAA